MRNYKSGQILPGQGTALPPKSSDGPVTQTMLAFDDNKLASTLFGQYGQNLALLERKLDVVADSRGNHVTIEGTREACDQARRVLETLYEQLRNGGPHLLGSACPPAHVGADVATPSQLLEPPQKSGEVSLAVLRRGGAHQHADPAHAVAPLRARRKRPK